MTIAGVSPPHIAEHYANDGRTNTQQVGFLGVCSILMMKKKHVYRDSSNSSMNGQKLQQRHTSDYKSYIQCCHLTSGLATNNIKHFEISARLVDLFFFLYSFLTEIHHQFIFLSSKTL